MQPIKEILKEIQFPIWLCWGISLFASTIPAIGALYSKNSEITAWHRLISIPGLTMSIVVMGLIFYCANDLAGRRKEQNKEMERWKAELAAMKTYRHNPENKTVTTLDWRIQSIEGIIGYLDQSVKMGHEPSQLAPIVLFLTKEIQKLREGK